MKFTLISIFLFCINLFGGEPAAKKMVPAEQRPDSTMKPPASNVLDFEADVIEGERNAPSLFVQMDIQAPKMETLMFMRKNFNDFHEVDKKRRPKYRSPNLKPSK